MYNNLDMPIKKHNTTKLRTIGPGSSAFAYLSMRSIAGKLFLYDLQSSPAINGKLQQIFERKKLAPPPSSLCHKRNVQYPSSRSERGVWLKVHVEVSFLCCSVRP